MEIPTGCAVKVGKSEDVCCTANRVAIGACASYVGLARLEGWHGHGQWEESEDH